MILCRDEVCGILPPSPESVLTHSKGEDCLPGRRHVFSCPGKAGCWALLTERSRQFASCMQSCSIQEEFREIPGRQSLIWLVIKVTHVSGEGAGRGITRLSNILAYIKALEVQNNSLTDGETVAGVCQLPCDHPHLSHLRWLLGPIHSGLFACH